MKQKDSINQVRSAQRRCLLFVEGAPFDHRAIVIKMKQEVAHLTIKDAHDEASLQKTLDESEVDIILCLYPFTQISIEQILNISHQTDPYIPIVIIVAAEDELSMKTCLAAGVHSYILNDHLTQLTPIINNALNWRQAERAHEATLKQLTISQSRLQAIANNTDDLIVAIDLNLQLTAFNQSFDEWCQKSHRCRPILGKPFAEYIDSTTMQQFKTVQDRVMNGEKITLRHTLKTDKSLQYFETSFSPIYSNTILTGITTRTSNITKTTHALKQINLTQQELNIKNQIDHCFHTLPQNQIHKSILRILRFELQTEIVILAFIHPNGVDFIVDTIDADKATMEFHTSNLSTDMANMWADVWHEMQQRQEPFIKQTEPSGMMADLSSSHILVAPLFNKGELIGLLHLINKSGPFTQNSVTLLQSVSAHIAPFFVAHKARHEEEQQRIKAEKAKRESDRRLKLLMDNLPGMAYRCLNDPQWTMKFVSAGCYMLTGYQPEELLENQVISFNDLIVEKYRQNIREEWQRVLLQHAIFQSIYQIQTSLGEIKWVWEQGQGVYDHHGHIVALEGFIIDITEHRQAQDRLRESEQRYRQLFESMVQGVVYHNTTGKIISANPAAERILGLNTDQNDGTIAFDPRWQSIREDGTEFLNEDYPATVALRTGKAVENIIMGIIHGGTGHRKWINISAIPQFSKQDPTPHSVFSTFEDITARYNASGALRQARDEARKANQLKDSFIANISHEIRTPLNALLGFSDLLQAQMPKSETNNGIERFVLAINQAGTRLMRSMDLILNYSRTQTDNYPIKLEQLDLHKLIQIRASSYLSVASLRNLDFSIENTCNNPIVNADEYSLNIAFDNLIDNALKYTTQGSVQIKIYCQNKNVCVEIIDTGIGMTPEFISTLFTPYTQEHSGENRAYEGLGLGLSLTYKLLEFNNATIHVESNKNIGSKFKVTFQQSIIHNTMNQNIDKSQKSDNQSLPIILVVEDDASSQFYMEVILQRAFQPIIVSNDHDAFHVLESNNVKMILMDLSLKEGMNGLEITRNVKKDARYAKIPVIAVTAHAFPADKQRSLEAGCDDYLAKPVKREDLLRVINNYILE